MTIKDFYNDKMRVKRNNTHLTPKNIMDFAEAYHSEQLRIANVSQQRELLLAYERSQYETTWWMSEAEATNRINDFLANNCG